MDNLLVRRWSRNATLVQGLAALDIIEELGFGLDRMVAAMADGGLPAPVFTEIGDTFVVTLYGAAAQLRASIAVTGREGRDEHPAVTAGESGTVTPSSQADRQAWVLDHLRTVGPIAAREYATARGISPATALRDLRDLVKRGLAQASGTTNDRRYSLRVDDGV